VPAQRLDLLAAVRVPDVDGAIVAGGGIVAGGRGDPPALSSVAALWQSIDTLALQRLDALLSMEAGAMGVTKDTLMRELFFASLSSPNGV
jgi:hypothetical protein